MNFTLGPAPLPAAPGANGAAVASPASDELAALRARREAAQAKATAAKEAREEASSSAAAQLEAEKIALADAERQTMLEEHEAAADAVYRAACLQHGSDRVARVVTRLGSIVMRPMSEIEEYQSDKTIAAFRREQERAKTPEEAAGFLRNAEDAARRDLSKTVLSDRAHFERVTTTHHNLWAVLQRAQNDLTNGRVTEEGKGAAR